MFFRTVLIATWYLVLIPSGTSQEYTPFQIDSLRQVNHIFKNSIHTVQLHQAGWELSYPVMELGSGDRLALSFDELAEDVGNYYYTFIHCDATWNRSELMETDYLDGFADNQIIDFAYSFNTTVPYLHYELTFPNEDLDFRISGNYILLVYENYDKSQPVLTRRFMVVEKLVNVQAKATRSSRTRYRETGQEIQVTVQHPRYPVYDPYQEMHVVISQNGRWDNAVLFDRPSFVRTGEVVYDFDERNIFMGGNEFRRFDIQSIRFQTEFVQYVDFNHPYYHIALFPAEAKPGRAHFNEPDLNGRYYIKIQEGRTDATEADYVKVYFTLKRAFPFNSGEVYVFGALSDWTCNWKNRMIYNYDAHAYETSMLLKQGYYNYEFAVKEPGQVLADNTIIEGSHYQTENDYLVYVYHRPSGARYDRLVGYAAINTVK
jgi:hypothetical protein